MTLVKSLSNDAGVASASIQTAVRFAAVIRSVAIAIEAGAIGLSTAAE
jgi:lipoyl-dependent peroxiredoxin subunit D